MKDKHKTAYAKKAAKAKAKRKSRIGPPRAALQLKTYSYQFKLASQVLVGTGGIPPLLSISGATGAGPLPLQNSNIIVYPSSSGLTNFYDFALAVPFKLEDVNNHAAFVAMYDAYKIRKVTCSLEFLSNVAATNGIGLMPTSYMVWDQDDSVIPVSITQISGKQGVKIRQFGNRSKTVQRFSLKPTISQDVLVVGGASVAATVSKSTWLDCIHPDIQHNALKMFVTDVYLPPNSSVTTAFRFNWTYDISFRSPLEAS